MARVSNWRKNLDRGLEFFGLKEEAYPAGEYEEFEPERVERPFSAPSAPEPAPAPYTTGVTVLGGGITRPHINTSAQDAQFRDQTPPGGTARFQSSPETSEVELFVATEYGQCRDICDLLKARRPVIVNTAHCDPETSRRIVAFVCGYIYSMNGRMQPLVKGSVILAEPIRSITVSPAAIDRFRLTRFER